MTTAEIITIIVGSGGLAGVTNIALTKWLESKSQKRSASHQGRLVAEHLESYAFACAGNAYRDWAILVDGSPGALTSIVPPFPPFSDELDWAALDSKLVDAARGIEQNFHVADVQTKTAFGKSAEKGYRYVLAESLRLGNEALHAAAEIRAHYRLRPLTFDAPRWDWVTFLRGEFEKLEERRRQIALKAAEVST